MYHFLTTVTPLFLQESYEDWGIKSILITACIALSGAIYYLHKTHKITLDKKDEMFFDMLKEKDARILGVIKEHHDDLKSGVFDMKSYVENYHKFTDRLIKVINANIKS